MLFPEHVPFEVEVPYVMRPGLRPWQPGEPILTTDQDFNRYQDQKIQNYAPVYGDNATAELVYSAARALKSFDNTAPDIEGDAPVWRLTRGLQEDFVIWAPNRAGQLSAQVLSVCLPSGWDPREKANKTFLEIHEPVPDFDTVNRASDHIAKMITTRGPFVRTVWTIANRSGLCRHPSVCEPWTAETLDSMWYRCERQVTIPVEDRAALFLIRVYMVPLRDVFEDSGRKQRVLDSLQSMTPAVVDYKGLGYVKDYFANRRV